MNDEFPQRFGPGSGRPLHGGRTLPGRPGGPGGGWPGNLPTTLLGLAIGLVVLAFIITPTVAARYTDWLWFREIGFERVFVLKIVAQWVLGLTTGLGMLALLYVNGRIAFRDFHQEPVPAIDRSRSGPLAQAAFLTRFARVMLAPAAVLLAALTAPIAASEWRTLVQFFYRSPFGVADPVFSRDIAYYVFSLPLVEAALEFAGLALMLALAAIAVPIYMARGEIFRHGAFFRVLPLAAVHLGVLSALLLVVTGLRMLLLGVPALLYAEHAPLQGASYTDLTVRVWTIRLLAVLTLAGAANIVWHAWRGRFGRVAGGTIATLIGLAMILVGIVPAIFQRLIVQPNELARETPQLVHHIEATRRAWGIDRVERRELGTEQGLTRANIEANQSTISNVRLWDRAPLLQTFGQIQAIRTYYDFIAVDDDRYRIDGELRQVMLSARELNSSALPTRTFINEHLTFTHGMGITLGPSNQVTTEGLPVLWIKDLPPESEISIRVTRPQIYFGELTNTFALAPSRQREFDYPAGEGDAAVYSQYDGRAGVPIGSFGRRLLFALRFRSINILFSGDLTPQTRVLFHRNVRERAELAMPFLQFDRDPYLVVTDSGALQWILDAYTVTSRYPYSQRLTDGTNYMRNSVKVTIDAYHGTVQAYLADPSDPMIRTLSRIYPDLLRPLEEMPVDLRAHLRYPEDLFRVQTSLYATFHMTNPETFYHREDQWQVPASRSGEAGEGFMRHIVMRLPGEPDPEFILMRPFTPRQKDNLAAWMVARNDGDNYGQLVAYRFPRQSLVFGPAQVVNRINQDTEVARQVSLWDQRGSEVIRGELLVIPIEGSLIYVQPLYLRAEGGRIPELKRVIVVHESRVAMEETLDAGLERLFGESSGDSRPPETPPSAGTVTGAPEAPAAVPTDLLRQAAQHYERARAAQRADDWATYGAEMRRLGEVLDRLNRTRLP